MEGRDGTTLNDWLKNNKHVKTVTRDRASAYAKVISETLPDAMQIADRFHLHQNLLEAIKKCISMNLPQTIRLNASVKQIDHFEVPEKNISKDNNLTEDSCKKNAAYCG